MARKVLSVIAAVALCLVRADPTPAPSTPQSSDPTTTTATGRQPFNLDNIVGKWRSYIRKFDKYYSYDMDIVKKTPAEIAVLKEQFLAQTVIHQLADVSWENVFFYFEIKINELNETLLPFLIESMTDPSNIKLISSGGQVDVMRIKLSDDKMTLRNVNMQIGEYNLYRTLPDLDTFARCQGFDDFDISDAVDADFLVGTWTPSGYPEDEPHTLRFSKKTTEELAAYRDDLRNITTEQADIDWTKVRLVGELLLGNNSRGHAFIEFLDKPGSIRVIPLKDAWDLFPSDIFKDWVTTQNVLIKKDDASLSVKNCHYPTQVVYLSRRPETRRRKAPRRTGGGRKLTINNKQ